MCNEKFNIFLIIFRKYFFLYVSIGDEILGKYRNAFIIPSVYEQLS